MKQTARLTFAILAFCFFISGLAGLVYQVVWTRYLALFLGHTSYAVVAVLVAFMGGLALGNAWLGAKADNVKKPLAFYAWLEIGIGIYALLFPSYYEFSHAAYVSVAANFAIGSPMALVLKFVFSLLTILLPTVLMGATLPVVIRYVTRALDELRQRVAALYAINSMGAVAGCWFGEFWWVPAIGLEATVLAGAALNFLAGVAALMLSLALKEGTLADVAPKETVAPEAMVYSPKEMRLALIAVGVSGFVAMLYEVAWTRLLALAIGSSTHAFTIMLMTFITGIAIGAWIVYRWEKVRDLLNAFGWAELALAVTLFLSLFTYEYLPFVFTKLASLLSRSDSTYPVYELLQMSVCAGVMLIPTICLGMTLPLISRVATTDIKRTSHSVGKVFAINTLGTVLGAAFTGLLLMPMLGLAQTFAVGIVLNALLAFAVLARNRINVARHWVVLTGLISVAVVLWIGAFLTPRWNRVLVLGLFRGPDRPQTLKAYRQLAARHTIRYYKDGAGSTVSVVAWDDGSGLDKLALRVNGKVDATSYGDLATQLLCAHLPLILKPGAERALIVGLGSGMTAAAAARHASVKNVDVVEISREVMEAARLFSRHNDDVHNQPKVKIVVDDAKSFLKLVPHKYDVIISEPSNPWMAGVAAVFSQEYYTACKSRLKDDGVIVQWLQMYETNERAVNTVFATFSSVFPHMSLWEAGPGDIILVGSAKPLEPNLERSRAEFDLPAIKSNFARFDLTSFAALLALQFVSSEDGLYLAPGDARLHSDYFPTLEYVAQRALFTSSVVYPSDVLDDRSSARGRLLLRRYLDQHEMVDEDFECLSKLFLGQRMLSMSLMRSLVYRWQKQSPTHAGPLRLTASFGDGGAMAELLVFRLSRARELLLSNAEVTTDVLRLYERSLMQNYRAHRSVFFVPPSRALDEVIARLMEIDHANERVYKLHMAELAWDRGDETNFVQLAESVLHRADPGQKAPNYDHDPATLGFVLGRLAELSIRKGDLQQAALICTTAANRGYTRRTSSYYDPVLALTCRKMGVGEPGAPQPSQ